MDNGNHKIKLSNTDKFDLKCQQFLLLSLKDLKLGGKALVVKPQICFFCSPGMKKPLCFERTLCVAGGEGDLSGEDPAHHLRRPLGGRRGVPGRCRGGHRFSFAE